MQKMHGTIAFQSEVLLLKTIHNLYKNRKVNHIFVLIPLTNVFENCFKQKPDGFFNNLEANRFVLLYK